MCLFSFAISFDFCLQDFVRLGPVKKSLSIERRAVKVSEKYTNKTIFEIVAGMREETKTLGSVLQQIKAKENENMKMLKSQESLLKMMSELLDEKKSNQDFSNVQEKVDNISTTILKVIQEKNSELSDQINEMKIILQRSMVSICNNS